MQLLSTLHKDGRLFFPPDLLFVVLVALNVAGCNLIGGIVKLSFWVGLIAVLLAALVIYALIRALFG